MQHGVRISNIILRSDNIWLWKILYHGEKSISTSNVHRKEANTREKLQKTEEEKSASKKRVQQVKWHSTNLALFGPIIKEETKKPKEKKTPVGEKKVKKPFGSNELLLPVSLWHNSSVELKLGKKGRYNKTTKNTNSPEENKLLQPEQVPIFQNKDNLEQTSNSKEKVPNVPNRLTEILLPDTPFFKKDDIILPFPMVLSKHVSKSCPNEIYTISSAKVDVPSVTQVLNKTMSDKSEMMLALWRKRKIAEVGEEGLKEFMRESKLVGKELHTSIETYLRGVEYSSVRVDPRISGHWLSMKAIINSIEDVFVLESYVVHPHLKYKGFVDCVARHKNDLVVIEWKTSQRTKATLEDAYDDPVQIAAYVGALNADDKYPFEVENALLVVAYPTGRPADVLTLNRSKCEHYWNQWLKRLETFNNLKSTREKE